MNLALRTGSYREFDDSFFDQKPLPVPGPAPILDLTQDDEEEDENDEDDALEVGTINFSYLCSLAGCFCLFKP